ncbi:MAG TPA: glycosyltransferase family 2 protein [Chthoniobacteraceae bacterium]|nr:glycosyltransferase family 2 protein [Chthoniobacteraceae bacterium]
MISMNEEKAVGQVIADIRMHAPEAEIVVVDSSKDRTPEIAEQAGARVIRQFPPQGYGKAMEIALRSGKGDVIITLDCDNTYPASQIPLLAKMVLEDGLDLVDASRLKGKPGAMPWINYLGNRLFAVIASILFGRHVTDLHSGMRAYRKSMIDALEFEAKGAALPVELLLLPIKLGYKVTTHFIDYFDRTGISTMNPFDTCKWTMWRIWRVWAGNQIRKAA